MTAPDEDLLDDFFHNALARAQTRRTDSGPSRGSKSRARGTRGRSAAASGQQEKYQDPQPVTDVLRSFLAEKGWAEEIAASQVLLDWPNLVGSPVGDNCRPVSLVDGVLTVSARNSAWASDLRWYRNKFLELINTRLAAEVVRDVRIRVDSGEVDPDFRLRM